MGTFLAQFCALCKKNWIILSRHKAINILRCVILPIAYAAFFAKAQDFFTDAGVLGPGHIGPLEDIPSDLIGHTFIWSPPNVTTTNATTLAFVDDLMGRVLSGVTAPVKKVLNRNDIDAECPENFRGVSECFAAIYFNQVSPETRTLSYTMRGDFGLYKVNVNDHTDDDVQRRLLPLQWAVDSNFIEMTTGTMPPSPYSWEYTNESQDEFEEANRKSYLRGTRSIIVLAHFLMFLGVVYQLPGSMASERANQLTSHLNAMGCRKSARVMSWHLSISSAYFPAWVCVAAIFHTYLYTHTNAGLFIVLYVVAGLNLASFTQLVVVPFANAPTLAAITSTFLAIILAICAMLLGSGQIKQLVTCLVFPPMFYIYMSKSLAAWELDVGAPNILHRSPRGDASILGLLVIAVIDIFLFPLIATWLENALYGVRAPEKDGRLRKALRRKHYNQLEPLPAGVAVQVDHLRKEYSTKRLGIFGRGKPVVAIQDLSLAVPKGEIFCLLGRNGAAKSTTLSVIARLINTSSGDVRYAKDLRMGIASQKDVLWDELNCKQHVALWRAIKSDSSHHNEPDLELLARCDLAPKTQFLSKNLSGGQKRKLQLACALAGGSNLLLLDEISSGLDPLSRRAIWKLITANRGAATIILTTHFLDEADYLGDHVAILQAPGRLLALDNPVALKTQLGRGYTISMDSKNGRNISSADLAKLREGLPRSTMRESRGKQLLITGSTDLSAVRRIVDRLQAARGRGQDVGYQVNSSTLEEVFLDLNAEPIAPQPESSSTLAVHKVATPFSSSANPDKEKDLDSAEKSSSSGGGETSLALTPGRKPSYLLAIPRDAYTIFLKRLIVVRRAWLLPLIAVLVVISATTIPLFFLKNRHQTCDVNLRYRTTFRLTYPRSIYPAFQSPIVIAPADAFGDISLPAQYVRTAPDNSSFMALFDDGGFNTNNITFGGISLSADPTTEASLFAWEGTAIENKGPSALNLISNAILDRISPPAEVTLDTAFRINLNYRYLTGPSFLSTAEALKWLAFFGLGVAIWPAFAVIYPTQERANNVRSNQYSNGATPVALWLGHILYEIPSIFFVSTVITVIFFVATTQFHAPGEFWISLVLYGISSTLWAFTFALWLDSALAAWALVAGINTILFLLYLAMYLLILTYDRSIHAAYHITIAHFCISLISPVPNMIRASLISSNSFGLLCDGIGGMLPKPWSDIFFFGGPILYMVVQILVTFGILVYVDSGSPIPAFFRRKRSSHAISSVEKEASVDVLEEKERLNRGSADALQVNGLRKRYSGADKFAVDDVTFGVAEGTTFALIGPNGAGKTTTLGCIRGAELPTAGDVTVDGHSIVKRRNAARGYLGVCPQVNVIDAQLTVRQHIWLYARLKGVPTHSIPADVHVLLSAAGLLPKADALAISLSGGNQRKLALAIALVGDRPVVLIDEFSSGVDPFSKREAWQTLERLTRDRAVVMTTHSMEEVDALASRVGIIASRMLAVGSPADLKSRFATYEIHLSAQHVDPVIQYLRKSGFAGAAISLDTSTRISVPGVREEDVSRLIRVLEGAKRKLGLGEMTIHEASTETAFLEIVRGYNVKEEEGRRDTRTSWWKRIRGKK